MPVETARAFRRRYPDAPIGCLKDVFNSIRQLAINELPVHDTHLRLDRDRVFGKFVVAFQLLGRLIVASYLIPLHIVALMMNVTS